jgi:murein L,D-transpeptidase YcbB/YkuD
MYLVFSPFWHVPHSLAVMDQVPMQQNDSAYFSRVGMKVFDGWGADAREIDPVTVDWRSLVPQSFTYRLRQDPGPQNALGRVKFMLPNRHNVYLHDTPSRDLFARAQRDFSSGCIRLEKAMDLAEYLLRDAPGWDLNAITAAATAGVETTVPLPNPIPVHILYWTAWANEDGTIHFRRDIYRRDERLLAALVSEPPGEG